MEFIIDDSTLVGCILEDGEHDIVIPEGVACIGASAFAQLSDITYVKFPSTIRTIEEQVFYKCINLTRVDIPWGLISIGETAFAYTGLEQIELPVSTVSIGDRAFSGCKKLSKVVLSPYTKTIGDYAFAACQQLSRINSPIALETYGNNVFLGCDLLWDENEQIILDGTLHEISFSVKEYTIPDTVTNLGIGAFRLNAGLRKVTFNSNITEIPQGVFNYCVALERIIIPDGVKYIRKNTFKNCRSLKTIIIPDSVVYIDPDAFDSMAYDAIFFINDNSKLPDNYKLSSFSERLKYTRYNKKSLCDVMNDTQTFLCGTSSEVHSRPAGGASKNINYLRDVMFSAPASDYSY